MPHRPTYRVIAEQTGYRPGPRLPASRLLRVVLEDIGATSTAAAKARGGVHADVAHALDRIAPRHRDALLRIYGIDGMERMNASAHSTLYNKKREVIDILSREVWSGASRPAQTLLSNLGKMEDASVVPHLNDEQLGDLLSDIGRMLPRHVAARGGLYAEVYEALHDLPPREHVILHQFYGLGGEAPRKVDDIAKDLDMSVGEEVSYQKRHALNLLRESIVAKSSETAGSTVSLHTCPDEAMSDAARAENYPSPEQAVIGGQYDVRVMLATRGLRPFDQTVFGMRLDGSTLQEIGDQFNLSRERVRQIASRAQVHAATAFNEGDTPGHQDFAAEVRRHDYLRPLKI